MSPGFIGPGRRRTPERRPGGGFSRVHQIVASYYSRKQLKLHLFVFCGGSSQPFRLINLILNQIPNLDWVAMTKTGLQEPDDELEQY